MKIKILFIFLILFISHATSAQFPRDNETGKVVYTGVLELPDMSKEVIYDKAKFWIISTLKSGDNMVELGGSNVDQIVGTGNLVLNKLDWTYEGAPECPPVSNLNFKFIVKIKDNKLKYYVENFDLAYGIGGYVRRTNLTNMEVYKHPSGMKKKQEDIINTGREKNEPYIDSVIKALLKDFIDSMENKDDDDDW